MFVTYGPGNTVTYHPLAIEKVPKKASKYENRPERYNSSSLQKSIRTLEQYNCHGGLTLILAFLMRTFSKCFRIFLNGFIRTLISNLQAQNFLTGQYFCILPPITMEQRTKIERKGFFFGMYDARLSHSKQN